MVVVASSSLQVFGVTIALERLCNMFLLFFRVWEVRTHLLSTVKEGAAYCHLVCQGVMGLEVQVLVRVCALPKHEHRCAQLQMAQEGGLSQGIFDVSEVKDGLRRPG